MDPRAAIKLRCSMPGLNKAPSLSDHCQACGRELASVFTKTKVSAVVHQASTKFFVVIGDGTLKTNRSKGGSNYVSAQQIESALPLHEQGENLLVCCWPGGRLSELDAVAQAVSGVANIHRLVVVWQGNEYDTMGLGDVPLYVSEHFTSLQISADSVNFVLPAPDEVWGYGPMYGRFALESQRIALQGFRDQLDVDLSGAFELGGKQLIRSHLAAAHHHELVGIVANWL